MRKCILCLLIMVLLFNFAGCDQKNIEDKYVLSISSEGKGTTKPPAGEHKYDKKAVVNLTATPDTENDWYFNKWGGPDGDEVIQNKILMDRDKVIKAIFAKNTTPILNEIGNKNVNEGNLLEFTVSGSDEDGDDLTFSASGELAEYFDPGTRTFSWTPSADDSGNYEIIFTISDGELSASETINIRVEDVDRPPVIEKIEDKKVDENSNLSFTVNASDPDGDTVTLSSSTLPGGASFDPETGAFSWTPGYEQSGTYNITFTAEAGGLIDNKEVVITVNNVNRIFTLNISVSPENSGTVTPSAGTHDYEEDQQVSLTATPDQGWKFSHWEGNVADTSSASTTVTMDEDMPVTAVFEEIHTLTVAKEGEGTVTPDAGTHDYPVGEEVSLTATPAQGWEFSHWEGDVTDNASGSTTVTMDSDKTVTAIFQENHTLTVAKEGEGTVTPNTGTYDYQAGEEVSLTATPAQGWEFSHWEGSVTDTTSASTTITMDSDKTVTAIFQEIHTLTVAKEGEGTVTPNTGTYDYQTGEEVSLTATPAADWEFSCWEGDVADTGSATTTLTMDGDKTVTAVFAPLISGKVTGVNSGDGIEEITINFSDGSFTTTDSDGYWNKAISGTVTVTPSSGAQYFGEIFEPANKEVSGPDNTVDFTFSGYRHVFSLGDVFGYPADLVVDSTGNIFVADEWNNKIHVLDSSGTYLENWGSSGDGDSQFDSPQGIGVNSADEIFVVDSFNNRIQKFDNTGGYLTQWGSEGDGEGTLGGEFFIPRGIAIDANDNIYIADTGNNRVQKFTTSDLGISYSDCWGEKGSGNGQFDEPHAIAINKSTNDFYVIDTANYRYQVFESDGTFKSSTGSYGSENSQFKYPSGIAVDNEGNIYVADTTNHRIQVFDSNSNFIRKWGIEGSEDGNFKYPHGLAVDASGNIYVADSNNFRIQKFAPVD